MHQYLLSLLITMLYLVCLIRTKTDLLTFLYQLDINVLIRLITLSTLNLAFPPAWIKLLHISSADMRAESILSSDH